MPKQSIQTSLANRGRWALKLGLLFFVLGLLRQAMVLIHLSLFLLFLLPFCDLLARMNVRGVEYQREVPERPFAREPFVAKMTLRKGEMVCPRSRSERPPEGNRIPGFQDHDECSENIPTGSMLDLYNMNTAGSKEPLRDNQPDRDNIQANIPILAQKHCESGGCGKVTIVIQKSDLEVGKPQPPVIVVYDCDKKNFH